MESGGLFQYRTLKQAVEFLGIGTHVNVPMSRLHPREFVYNAHELIDISHLLEMMLDFPWFAILANPGRFDNLRTYGGAVSFAAEKLVEIRKKEKIDFKPALVLDTPQNVEQTAKALRFFFDGELVVYLVCREGLELANPCSVLDDDTFKETLKSLDRNDVKTAKTVFVMPYIDLFRSHYKDVYVPVKDLPEPWRERLGLNDVDDAKTDVVNESCETPGEQPTLTPAERAACLSDSINDQGTHGLVKLCEAEDYIDFGPVICEKADLFICHDLPSRKLLSMLNGDSLILVAENPKLYDYTHVLRCLRLVIRSFPPLPAFSKDYRLSDLYHHDFDPEIGIIAPEHTAGTGQKRRIESGHQPLIRIPPPTEEEAYFANLYYHRDRRWWTFSSRLFWLTVKQLDFNSYACRDVVNCVVSQLVMRRRSRGWVPYSKSEDEDKKTTG